MNKAEIIKAIAKKTGKTEVVSRLVLDTILESVLHVVEDGESINIPSFGTIKVTYRLPRQARNLKTGEVISIPAQKAVVFSASQAFKDELNK